MEHISLYLLFLGTFAFGGLAFGYGCIANNFKKGLFFAVLSIACAILNLLIH